MAEDAGRPVVTHGACMVVRLSDGLGNQLFQYAFGRALARRTGARVWFDAGVFSDPAAPRRYGLDRLGLRLPLVRQTVKIDVGAGRVRIRRPLRWRIRASPFRRTFRLFAEKRDFVFDPAVFAQPDDCYFQGFWQAHRYVADQGDPAGAIDGEIRLPVDRLAGDARTWLERIRGSDAVALHVRRGDYLDAHIQATHGLCRMPYYLAAIDRVTRSRPGAELFVFSDDPAWCREAFSGVCVQVVDTRSAACPEHDLALMAACRHHVVANSSFSWWAAWLARHPAQIVVAPTPWTTRDGPAPDLLPAGWTVLDRDTGEEAPGAAAAP